MKLLIYAFEPFGNYKQNISQEVIGKLSKRKGVEKVVLPVAFKKNIFIDTMNRVKPDAVLGLGQYPRGKKIRIERLARSRDKTSTKLVTLKLQPDASSWISYNAGSYVCNYSMYVLLTEKTTKNIPFAFLHIPKSFDWKRAVRFVEAKIEEILA